jgi:hypothetical protein
MARLAAALLALLIVVPAARAADRFVPVFDAESSVAFAGSAFVSTTRDGHLRVTDRRGRLRYEIALPGENCWFGGATAAGVALIPCYEADDWLLDLRSAALSPIDVRGDGTAIGRHWIESIEHGDCSHCTVQVFINRRTGAVKQYGAAWDSVERDLDDPGLAFLTPPSRTFRTVRLPAQDATILYRRVRGGWERVARCRAFCRRPEATRGRISYFESGRGQFVERDLRTGRTRRWRLPLSRGWIGVAIHRAPGALYISRSVREGVWRVWRAKR